MIQHRMDEYQNYLLDSLWNNQFDGTAIKINKYFYNFSIYLKVNEKYFGKFIQ